MNFKERILTAMNHEEPDRVPVMGLIMDPSTVNQIKGKKPVDFVGLLKKPVLGQVVKELMNTNWFWNRMYGGNFAGALECAIELGFDANWIIYAFMQLHRDAGTSLGLVWHDVYGRVWELGTAEDGGLTVNYSRPLCAVEEQWERWVEENAPLCDRLVENVAGFHKGLTGRYGDKILPIGYAAPGIFENSWQPIGFVNFTRLIYQKPDFVKKVIDFQTDLYVRCLDAVMESDVDIVLGGDDLGQKTGPTMRPELIEKLLGESYRRVAELVHKRNKKLIWHSCGNIYKLLDMFVEWGFDGIITMEPTAGMELGKVREQVGHKLVMVGNLDVSYLLVKGTREEIEEAVKQALRDAARGGGYILSASHSHPYVDGDRLGWMVEAVHKYGKYPIAV
ncbi:MAG: uroporphyrinogen decarboxylase family protein [Chloroflexota bacterium]|nr:uroporphyrinogen decarboxylase family protein [Chloroflexota bacterium]